MAVRNVAAQLWQSRKSGTQVLRELTSPWQVTARSGMPGSTRANPLGGDKQFGRNCSCRPHQLSLILRDCYPFGFVHEHILLLWLPGRFEVLLYRRFEIYLAWGKGGVLVRSLGAPGASGCWHLLLAHPPHPGVTLGSA